MTKKLLIDVEEIKRFHKENPGYSAIYTDEDSGRIHGYLGQYLTGDGEPIPGVEVIDN